jgi:hypothetical protein
VTHPARLTIAEEIAALLAAMESITVDLRQLARDIEVAHAGAHTVEDRDAIFELTQKLNALIELASTSSADTLIRRSRN